MNKSLRFLVATVAVTSMLSGSMGAARAAEVVQVPAGFTITGSGFAFFNQDCMNVLVAVLVAALVAALVAELSALVALAALIRRFGARCSFSSGLARSVSTVCHMSANTGTAC